MLYIIIYILLAFIFGMLEAGQDKMTEDSVIITALFWPIIAAVICIKYGIVMLSEITPQIVRNFPKNKEK